MLLFCCLYSLIEHTVFFFYAKIFSELHNFEINLVTYRKSILPLVQSLKRLKSVLVTESLNEITTGIWLLYEKLHPDPNITLYKHIGETVNIFPYLSYCIPRRKLGINLFHVCCATAAI